VANTNACNATPANGDLGITGGRLILPGNAALSIVPARINRRDVNGMPPLGSNVIDNEGVLLIQQWINSLTGC